jgi:leukotriene-A4 hydrolase
LKKDDVELMGETYGFAKSKNVEVVSRYFGVGLRAEGSGVYQPTAGY